MSAERLARLVAELEVEIARLESIVALGAHGMTRPQLERINRRRAELEAKRDLARAELAREERRKV